MLFKLNIKSVYLFLILLFSVIHCHGEEDGLWQKFKNFFSPMKTVEGEGPDYDKIRELDKQISKLEGKYSRERRYNNKLIIKKEIDSLKVQREKNYESIDEKKISSENITLLSSSSTADTNLHFINCKSDTILIHDTLFVHDTLYVIVQDRNKNSNQEDQNDSSQVKAKDDSEIQSGIK